MRHKDANKKLILTSSDRILELPVSLDEMKDNETIVATNVNVGLLFVKEYKSGKSPTLFDRDSLTDDDLKSTDYDVSFVSVPLIDAYVAELELKKICAENVKSSLLKKLNIVNNIEDQRP